MVVAVFNNKLETNNDLQNITQKAKDLKNLQDGCSSAKQQIGDKQWSTKHYTES